MSEGGQEGKYNGSRIKARKGLKSRREKNKDMVKIKYGKGQWHEKDTDDKGEEIRRTKVK